MRLSAIALALPLLFQVAVAEAAAPAESGAAALSPPSLPPPKETEKTMGERLEWRWPTFRTSQIVLLATQLGVAVGSTAIPGAPRWTSVSTFDGEGQRALRFGSLHGRLYARDASDVGLILLVNQRLFEDLVVTWWMRDKGSTALQLMLIDAQAVSFAAAVNGVVAGIVGRERPSGQAQCGAEPERSSRDCTSNDRYRSFFSGHSTAAFTLATLTCSHHMNLPIYGGGPVEALPCAGALATAAGVAALRVAADQHYPSDVLVGAAFGALSGFAIPYAFHYGYESTDAGGGAAISILPTPTGASVLGVF